MKNPVFPSLPPDMERVILEVTGGLEHVDKIKMLKDDIHFQGVCNYLHNLPDFEWFEHITFEEATDYMNMFTQCKCCERHKKKRPSTRMFMEGFIPEGLTIIKPDTDYICKCKCRHLSRIMCYERDNVEEEFNAWVQN